jgi:predicted porin
MKRLGFGLLTAVCLASLAHAADAPPGGIPPPLNCFDSLTVWLNSSAEDCPLALNGLTLYGRIDVGGARTVYPNGVEELISKNSHGSRYVLVPNGLGQSNVGVKGLEPLAGGWSLVFNLQTGFDPYTLKLADGPTSLVQNNAMPLDSQTANDDSIGAGQMFNTVAYAGFSNRTWAR